ncbi:MAG: hypothetical protein PHC51_04495 [bacterium]|nr:hypothetical protein [bacterium]
MNVNSTVSLTRQTIVGSVVVLGMFALFAVAMIVLTQPKKLEISKSDSRS